MAVNLNVLKDLKVKSTLSTSNLVLSSNIHSIADLSDSTSNVINLTSGFVTHVINGSNVNPLTTFEICPPLDPIPDQFIIVSNLTGTYARLQIDANFDVFPNQSVIMSYVNDTWISLGFFFISSV